MLKKEIETQRKEIIDAVWCFLDRFDADEKTQRDMEEIIKLRFEFILNKVGDYHES